MNLIGGNYMSKKIPLKNGMFAIVDDEDYERVSKHSWYVGINNNKRFEVYRCIEQGKPTHERLSRFIFNLESSDNRIVAFKNKNNLDHRKENLIICTKKENAHMRRGDMNSSSKYKGVYWETRRSKWRILIQVAGKKIHLGYSDSEDEAAKIYNRASLEYFGKYSYQNIIGANNNTENIDKKSKQKNVPQKQNFNRRSASYSSSYMGVSWHKRDKKWRASIKGKYIGSFKTEEAAAKAYDQKAYELYEDKAILNFPQLVGAAE